MKKLIFLLLLSGFLMAQDSVVYVYNYDDNGVYINSKPARVDPESNPVVYLLPKNATFTAPPPVGTNQTAVFDGDKWKKVKDYRGYVYYDKDNGKKIKIDKVNEEIPSGYPVEPPPTDIKKPKYVGNQWIDEAVYFHGVEINEIVTIDMVVKSLLINNGIEPIIEYLEALQNGQPVPQSWTEFVAYKDALYQEAETEKNKVK